MLEAYRIEPGAPLELTEDQHEKKNDENRPHSDVHLSHPFRYTPVVRSGPCRRLTEGGGQRRIDSPLSSLESCRIAPQSMSSAR